jgi:hypothetical protein
LATKRKTKSYNPWAICTNVAKEQGWDIRGKKWERCVKDVKKKRGAYWHSKARKGKGKRGRRKGKK